MSRAAALAAAAATLGGCTLITDSFLSNDFSGDPYPVQIDTSSGAIVVGLQPAGGEIQPAVLDLLSPLTINDPGIDVTASVAYLDLTLLDRLMIPRARFPGAQLIAVHPCDGNEANGDGLCHVGADGTTAYQSVIGADVLAGDAVRLRLGDDQLFVLPDVGGDDRHRTLDCDAVFDSPYRGGGTLVIAGTELPFGNRRIAMQACLSPAPTAAMQTARGTDALLVISTSIGVTILGQSAYQRYQVEHPTALPPDAAQTVYLPSGVVHGQHARIDGLALVATSSSNALAPCRQIYAHRALEVRSLGDNCEDAPNGDCPCENGSGFCTVPAILELSPPGGIDVLVVADTDPTLQALRTELRPDQPEVDGIIGTQALRGAEIDVDYPHDRLLARCPGGNCCVRPELAQESDRDQINRCLTSQDPAQLACPIGLPAPAPAPAIATPRRSPRLPARR